MGWIETILNQFSKFQNNFLGTFPKDYFTLIQFLKIVLTTFELPQFPAGRHPHPFVVSTWTPVLLKQITLKFVSMEAFWRLDHLPE